MSSDIRKKDKHEIAESRAGKDIEVLEPAGRTSPFISFRYSYKEVTSDGINTRVRSKEKSFENGKFKSEEFEGRLPGSAYINMVSEMQKLFLNQIMTIMKPFSIFLPPGSKHKEK